MKPGTLARTTIIVSAAFILGACAGSSGTSRDPAAPAAQAAPAASAVPAAQPAPAAPAQPAQVAATDPSEEVVCKKYQQTGSRIAVRKVCKTRAEWVEYSQHMKNAMRAAERRSAGAGAPPSMGGG